MAGYPHDVGRITRVTCTLHVAWDERLTSYDFGPDHPLAPIRVKLTMELAQAFGLLSCDGVTMSTPPLYHGLDAELALVHAAEYIAVVKAAGALAAGRDEAQANAAPIDVAPVDAAPVDAATLLKHGLGTADDPVFAGMHEASALVAGATLAAVRAVWSGSAQHGASIAGGLHHAMRGNASGFCVYNDPAIAIAWLLEQGAERIASVDIDVHHGDGVQAAFWNDPRVLTISMHEHPATLFPGTGLSRRDRGPGRGRAPLSMSALLEAGTWGRRLAWPCTRSCRRCCASSVRSCWSASTAAIRTGAVIPGRSLRVTIDAQRAAHALMHQLAHETADGNWLLTGGGGYQLVKVGAQDLDSSCWPRPAVVRSSPARPRLPRGGEYVDWVATEPAPDLR